jgi:hypothetical protein
VEDNALKKLPGYSVIDVRCLDTVS